MLFNVIAGSADVTVAVLLRNTDGSRATGKVYTDINIDWWKVEIDNDVVLTNVTPVDLATPALTDSHLDWGFLEIGFGWYRLDVADAVVATGLALSGVHISGTGLDGADVVFSFGVNIKGVSDAPVLVSDVAGAFKAQFSYDVDGDPAEVPPTLVALTTAIRKPVLSGTAGGGGSNYILLPAGANANDDFYKGVLVVITGGTGVGQHRWALSYDAAGAAEGDRKVVVDTAWITNPDATSTFDLL